MQSPLFTHRNDKQIIPVIKPKAPKKTAIIQYGSCHWTRYPATAASAVVTTGIGKRPVFSGYGDLSPTAENHVFLLPRNATVGTICQP
jgi:hypothetical protein